MIIRYVRAQPALAYEKNLWKTEFLFLVPFIYNLFILNIRHKNFVLYFCMWWQIYTGAGEGVHFH